MKNYNYELDTLRKTIAGSEPTNQIEKSIKTDIDAMVSACTPKGFKFPLEKEGAMNDLKLAIKKLVKKYMLNTIGNGVDYGTEILNISIVRIQYHNLVKCD